jgi:acyl transferase domain-containing protein
VSKQGVEKFDIRVSDEQGRVSVELLGFSTRPLGGVAPTVEGLKANEAGQVMLLRPRWEPAPALQAKGVEGDVPEATEHCIVLCEQRAGIERELSAVLPGARYVRLDGMRNAPIEDRYREHAWGLLECIQETLRRRPDAPVRLQLVVTDEAGSHLHRGLGALLRSARHEHPPLSAQLLLVDAAVADSELAKVLKDEAGRYEPEMRIRPGMREVPRLEELDLGHETAVAPWKDNGVYLVTGGLGGIGQLVSRSIARQAPGARLVLAGRSELTESLQDLLDDMRSTGAQVDYRCADVSISASAQTLVDWIEETHGGLTGVIHCAGVLKDNLLLNKTRDQVHAVFAPKVQAMAALDRATRRHDLEFFVCFSSTSALFGNAGQTDYSAANAFLDQYARHRNALVKAGERSGWTIALNWPLWEEGGMRIGGALKRQLRERIGMQPLGSDVGMAVLQAAIRSREDQVVVLCGVPSLLRSQLLASSAAPAGRIADRQAKPQPTPGSSRSQTHDWIVGIIADEIKLPRSAIQPDVNFEKYGIDSLVQASLVRRLQDVVGELPKTLLFERSNVDELVDHLLKHKSSELASLHPAVVVSHDGPADPAPPLAKGAALSITRRMHSHGVQGRREAKAEPPDLTDDDVAIIGVSGRYPGSDDLESLWDNLMAGRNCISAAPVSRWSMPADGSISHVGGFLSAIDRFDHRLFGIPEELVSATMTPETRLFMEVVWETLEDAGYTRSRIRRHQERDGLGVGVFVGAMYDQSPWLRGSMQEAALISNMTGWHIANRTSHYFDLNGPSLAVNSACSGSMTAIHLACESLRQRTASMAIAGGVNLTLEPSKYLALEAARFLERGDASRSFGVGTGYLPGEGVGAVMLKLAKAARADGDKIHGLIKHSFINHAGGRQAYCAPDPKQQSQVIAASLIRGGIDSDTITYVESAANGSPLGDSIEIRALSDAFGRSSGGSMPRTSCAIGSVKSNIGHLEAASGISQLSKVLLQLRHGVLAPSINAVPRNPNIKWDDTRFRIQEAPQAWERQRDPGTGAPLPRRAMITSFGAGGSYASMVVEECALVASPGEGVQPRHEDCLFLFSAQVPGSLHGQLQDMLDYLRTEPPATAKALATALSLRNHDLPCRLAIVARTVDALAARLAGVLAGSAGVAQEGVFSAVLDPFGPSEVTPERLRQTVDHNDLIGLAHCWVAGEPLEAVNPYRSDPAVWLPLPRYSFDHSVAFGVVHEATSPAGAAPQGLASPATVATYRCEDGLLRDHRVNGVPVLIGAAHASLALRAAAELLSRAPAIRLTDLRFVTPVQIPDGQTAQVKAEVDASRGDGSATVVVRYRYAGRQDWNVAATGQFETAQIEDVTIDIDGFKRKLQPFGDLERLYAGNPMVQIGGTLKTIVDLHAGPTQVLATVALKPDPDDQQAPGLHALIINTAFLAVAALPHSSATADGFLPFGINRLTCRTGLVLTRCSILVTLVKRNEEIMVFDADIVDGNGHLAAQLRGGSIKRVRSPGGGGETSVRMPPRAETPEEAPADRSLESGVQQFLVSQVGLAGRTRRAVTLDSNFMDLGMESANLLELTRTIGGAIGVELDQTLLFEYPNIRELAQHLGDKHRAAMSRVLGQIEPARQVVTERHAEKAVGGAAVEEGAKPVEASAYAIIGMSGRLAGADDLDAFWDNLCTQAQLIEEIPLDHWDSGPWFDPKPGELDKTYSKWGSFIEGVDKFDAAFFGISPREAEWLDPQVRLLLESVYATAEDAGVISTLRGSDTGVFVGVCFHDYAEQIAELGLPMNPYSALGSAQTVVANRISFQFDLNGPSIAYDTACSSALFALHSACRAISNGECGMAIVGAANLLLSSQHYRYFSSIGALSPTGRCHTFDARADGYVPGECVASILLKPLAQAMADGDRIEAVVRGSAALHGGYTPSLTAPSVAGEENVIVKAWVDAGIDPATRGYIEAHGTGTKLGDPVEIKSLVNAFNRFTDNQGFCAIGSAKANVGHTEGAAGLVGILKVIQQMKHRTIPALLGFESLNPGIQLEGSALFVNREAQPWTVPDGQPRRAGVSAFGFSGAYAHVVIEEHLAAAPVPDPANEDRPALFVLSARTEPQLKQLAANLLNTLRHRMPASQSLADVAYTLQVGREAMACRLAFAVADRDALERRLEAIADGTAGDSAGVYRGHVASYGSGVTPPSARILDDAARLWRERRDEHALLELWVAGAPIDWHLLYQGRRLPKRISLPTYPFIKERYWVERESIPSSAPEPGSVRHAEPAKQTDEHAYSRILDKLLSDQINLDQALRYVDEGDVPDTVGT